MFYSGERKRFLETALAIQQLRLHLPVQGVCVQSLVGDLGILVASQSKKKKKKRNGTEAMLWQFNKDFERMVHIKK